MALDSSILNATAHPPKPDIYGPNDWADYDTKQANLGAMAQQKQLRDQQIQENAMKLDAQRKVQEDQAKFSDLYKQNNYDMNKALAAAPAAGINPAFIQQADKDNQEVIMKRAQAGAEVNKQQIELADRVAGYLQPIQGMQDPGQKAAAWAQAVKDAQAAGLPVQGIPAAYPGDQGVDAILSHALGAKWYAEQGLKKQQEARAAVLADTAAKEAPGKIEKANNDAIISGLGLASRTVGGAVAPAPPPAPGTAPYPAAPLAEGEVSPEQEQWSAWRDNLSPSTKKFIPENYSPDAVKKVQRMGLTGYQETEADAREQRAKRLAAIPGKNIAELAQIANNEDLPIEERDLARKSLADIKAQKTKDGGGGGGSKPLSGPQLRVLKNEHDTAYRNEQDQWTLAGQLGDVSSVKDDEKFYNPASKKEMTMNPQIRQLLKSQYEAARRKATEYQQEGRDIRAKLGGPTGDDGGKAPATQVAPGPPPKGAKFTIGQTVYDKQGKAKKVLGYDAQGKVVTD